jgi:catalase (peroxidase I)
MSNNSSLFFNRKSMTKNYQKVADEIRAILNRKGYDDGSAGPVIVRLAWHACGTYDKATNTGGSDGATMRFYPEATDGANAGLDVARAMLEPVKVANPWISYGDLWTLAGVVAIESMGGPKIVWKPGRSDKAKESDCPPQGRLPDATQGAKHIRDVFYRMGFNDREIVALSGAHGLGRCHKERSGFVGPWTYTPIRFSNQYFVLLTKEKWIPVTKYPGGPLQYKDAADELMMLPTDMVLVEDSEFKKYVDIYAKDKETFYKDFAAAFAKLTELGVRSLGKPVAIASSKQPARI